MKNALYGLRAAWQAEKLKLRGSRIVTLIIALGVSVPLLYVISEIFDTSKNEIDIEEKLPFNFLLSFIETPIFVFGSLFFPLALVLIIARLSSIEHKSDTWKLVGTQPISSLSFWLVKFGMALVLSAGSILFYFIFSLLFGYIWSLFVQLPTAAYLSIPFRYMAALGFRLWLSGLGILIFQQALSMRIRSAIWPIVIGICLFIVTQITTFNKGPLAYFWPYSLPGFTALHPEGSQVGYWLLPSEWQGILWLLISPLVFIFFRYRNSFVHSFQNTRLWLISFVGICLLVLGTWWLQQPKSVALIPGRTVIAGTIHAAKLPDSIVVLTNPTGSIKVPIQSNGTFYVSLDLPGDLEKINLRIYPDESGAILYAGRGDSVFVDWSQGKKPELKKIKLTGTSIATNEFFSSGADYLSSYEIEYYLANQSELPAPISFYELLMKEWKKNHEKPGIYRTADGLGLSSTVRTIQEKLVAVKFLTFALYDYPKKKNIDLNNREYDTIRSMLKPLLNQLEPYEERLVGWKQYHDYLYMQITNPLSAFQNDDSAFYAAIMKYPAGPMRNRLIYDISLKQLKISRDSVQRAAIMGAAIFENNNSMREDLLQRTAIYNRMRKGRPAPLFDAHNYNDEAVSLTSLRGKYVVIDIWATWCPPCREQTPIFEKMSEKYKDQPITFLSLSTDYDLLAWQQEVKRKNNRILHWRLQREKLFLREYGLEGIPHFILIDPDGNFVNANFPRPGDQNFEIQLRQVLKLKSEEG